MSVHIHQRGTANLVFYTRKTRSLVMPDPQDAPWVNYNRFFRGRIEERHHEEGHSTFPWNATVGGEIDMC